MSDSLHAVLSALWLFEDLSEAEFATLLQSMQIRTYRSKEIIVKKGDPADGLYVILDGHAKVASQNKEGWDTAFSVMGPNEAFGEIALLDGQPRSATVTTMKECQVAYMPVSTFRHLLIESPTIAVKLLGVLAKRVRRLSQNLEDRDALGVRERLAKQLLSLAEASPEGLLVDLSLSQQELGDLVGATRESVNKHLREWKKQGLIEQRRRALVLHDVKALRSLAGS